jgi:hypothetical protein
MYQQLLNTFIPEQTQVTKSAALEKLYHYKNNAIVDTEDDKSVVAKGKK